MSVRILVPILLILLATVPVVYAAEPAMTSAAGLPPVSEQALRIHDKALPAGEWLASYTGTYVERDVRQVLNVGDLNTFQAFLRMCAGRSAQLLNLSALGADCGVSHNTARSWLSVLETAFLVFRLPAFHATIRKRLTRTPKLYFYDSGLLCYLLGIRSPEELRHHPAVIASYLGTDERAIARSGAAAMDSTAALDPTAVVEPEPST